ncbi:cytochrome B [Pedobacter sp. JY14-1]|uniref:cytochrome B n=1 Tax=Pedobacter sp. JY14-1 TaxID=3034151 RepID=UPI0023E08F9D|nr:cytochrome B [Pedobacter sp. JY14-1]
MYEILKSAHSGWRYIVLVLLVLAFVRAMAGWLGKQPYTEGNRKLNVFALISAHIQLVFGLLLYFIGSWFSVDSSQALGRYWKMEHIGMMIFAIVLITVGNARSKRGDDPLARHRAVALYFGLALVLIFAAIIAMTKADPSRTFFGVS